MCLNTIINILQNFRACSEMSEMTNSAQTSYIPTCWKDNFYKNCTHSTTYWIASIDISSLLVPWKPDTVHKSTSTPASTLSVALHIDFPTCWMMVLDFSDI